MHALGGDVSVTSTLGRGSTFTFTAQLSHAAAAAPVAGATAPLAAAGVRCWSSTATRPTGACLVEQLEAWTEAVVDAPAREVSSRLRAPTGAVRGRSSTLAAWTASSLARRPARARTPARRPLVLLTSDRTTRREQADAAGFTTLLRTPVGTPRCSAPCWPPSAAAPRRTTRQRPPTPPPCWAADAVLVVEDNPVNQLVATGLLESLGYAVTIASDGVEGVALLRGEHDIAAVLMDCRMPRMDGFDATREVRRHESPGRRVPIIAMTASALAGERERCLAAGMDDFLTKPVDVTSPRRLQRWLRRPDPLRAGGVPGRSCSAASHRRPPRPQDSIDPRATAVLDPERVQMLTTGQGRPSSSARGPLPRTHRRADHGHPRAPAGRDAAAAAAYAHPVKGSALNVGLPRVAAAAAAVGPVVTRVAPRRPGAAARPGGP